MSRRKRGGLPERDSRLEEVNSVSIGENARAAIYRETRDACALITPPSRLVKKKDSEIYALFVTDSDSIFIRLSVTPHRIRGRPG